MHPESPEHASIPGEGAGQDTGDATRPDIPPPGRPPPDEARRGSGSGRPPGTFRRGGARFRAWRRGRPFWGGLLLILAGLELLLIPVGSLLVHGAVKIVIYIGIGGVFGIIFGCVLIACGLLSWFHPVQRVFYAVVGALLALGSFVVTNLGGFFLGMLLGVIGASLVFGWTPVTPQDRGRHRTRRAPEPSDGLDAVLGEPDTGPVPGGDSPAVTGPEQPPGSDRAEGGHAGPPGGGTWHTGAGSAGLLALPIAPVLVLAGVLAGGQAPASVSPAAGPAATVTPSPPASASPVPSATSPSPSGSGSPAPSPGPSPSGSGSPTPSPGPSPSGSGSPTPSPSPSVNPNAGKRTSAAPALVAASSPATLPAGSALMEGLSYDGVATVPTAGGSQQMLKFSMSSLTLSGGIVLTVGGNGHSMVTRNSSVQFTGNVVLYATRLSGDLLGVPLTFTPASPPPLVLPLMQFTNVVTQQPLTSAGTMQASGLDITG